MALPLPPKSAINCDATTAQLVHAQLTSVIAGHPQATTTYRFYEELDTWLGPWGERGYPIAYGKFYNVAFSTNEKLMANAKARDWVARAVQQDQRRLQDEMALGRELSATRARIDRGDLDYIPVLDQVIATLNGRQFPDQGFARAARDVVAAATARRQMLVQKINLLLDQSPAVRSRVESRVPQFVRP